MSEFLEIFRQRIEVEGTVYGKVGFRQRNGEPTLYIVSHDARESHIVEFSLVAVPRLIALLQQAWATKTRPTDADTYAFTRLEETER